MAKVVGLFRVGSQVVELFAAVSQANVERPLIGQGSRRRRTGERLALIIDNLGQYQIVWFDGSLGGGTPVTVERTPGEWRLLHQPDEVNDRRGQIAKGHGFSDGPAPGSTIGGDDQDEMSLAHRAMTSPQVVKIMVCASGTIQSACWLSCRALSAVASTNR